MAAALHLVTSEGVLGLIVDVVRTTPATNQ
jgi:hypothetical protein